MIFRKKEPSLEVIVGAESGIKGDLTTKGAVKFDGVIDGCIRADWLIVGETGMIRGDVSARGTIVYGKIEGNIESSEITEIKAKAVVEGDIRTAKLVVSEGAIFEGRSHMQKLNQIEAGGVLSIEQKVKKSLME
ncbi:MAG TPA: polymer-forming cytoskeletal protein [Syntrophorhabdaceae bacterium]|jgi:cytoskeletal protein CcmA (bactofilin family)